MALQEMSHGDLIGMLTEIDTLSSHARQSTDVQRRHAALVSRAGDLRLYSVIGLCGGCVALCLALCLPLAGRLDRFAAPAAAIGVILFAIALACEDSRGVTLQEADRLLDEANGILATGEEAERRCRHLLGGLPRGYADVLAVSDMLKALTTGRAQSLRDAQQASDRYRSMRDVEQRERQTLEQCTRQADAAEREYKLVMADIGQMELEIQRLKDDRDALEKENARFREHIARY